MTTVIPRLLTDRERESFWAKVVKSNGCWIWAGALSTDGYGKITLSRRPSANNLYLLAHRIAYELLVGPIPEGLQIDHLCRNRACVNPAHMEAVTSRENTLRGTGFVAVNAAKDECVNGHPFDEKNTYRRPNGNRSCRACHLVVQKRYLARRAGNTE